MRSHASSTAATADSASSESAQDRRSLLAVTSQTPWPLDSGGHLRTYHLLRTLATRFDVRLVTSSRALDGTEREALERAGVQPRVVAVPPRTAVTETLKVVIAAAKREPYVMFARHRRHAIARALREESRRQRPDVVYLDHLDSLAYARIQPDVPLVVDMHNVYSSLAARSAAEATDAIRRRYLKREAALIARMEERAVQLADTILAVSDDDARYFSERGAKRVVVVPNGVDCDAYDRLGDAARTGPPTILYVGSLAWPPNASAARFLADDVLPAVRRHVPDVCLTIVGKDPARELLALAQRDSHVHIAGHVPDVARYFREAHVLAVPLEAGGGTRLKILEAFAAGLPVVGTPVGCEGIVANDGTHFIVAERSEFAAAITRLLLDPDHGRRLAERARHLARARYDWSVVGTLACDAIAGAARQSRPSAHALPGLAIHTSVTTR